MTFVILKHLILLIFYPLYSSSLKCYECTGYVPCGSGQTHLLVNCGGKCMVYQNQYDGNVIIRRCCWSNCGGDGVSFYEGRLTYFCSGDMCNGDIADINLIEQGSGEEPETTTPSSVSTLSSTITTGKTTSMNTASSSLTCYECTGHYSKCGISQDAVLHNCRMCMVYLNIYDGNTVVRRCCTWGCGLPGSVQQYEGRQAYFCSSNLCNGIGAESILTSKI
ncbi:unnamed protein product, partial [Rotaria sordida]